MFSMCATVTDTKNIMVWACVAVAGCGNIMLSDHAVVADSKNKMFSWCVARFLREIFIFPREPADSWSAHDGFDVVAGAFLRRPIPLGGVGQSTFSIL
jgi:hypothetical protein